MSATMMMSIEAKLQLLARMNAMRQVDVRAGGRVLIGARFTAVHTHRAVREPLRRCDSTVDCSVAASAAAAAARALGDNWRLQVTDRRRQQAALPPPLLLLLLKDADAERDENRQSRGVWMSNVRSTIEPQSSRQQNSGHFRVRSSVF